MFYQTVIAENKSANSVEIEGAVRGTFLDYQQLGQNASLQLRDSQRNLSLVWQGSVGEAPAKNKRSDENLPYPDMSLVQASLKDGVLAVLFEFNLLADDSWHKAIRHKPKFVRIFNKSDDGTWHILVSLTPASLWWDSNAEDITNILVKSPNEFEIVFKRGWILEAFFLYQGESCEISVFEDSKDAIGASNDNMITKRYVDESMRRTFQYDSKNAILYLLDPKQRKVIFRNSIWWPTHSEIDDFPRGGYHWTEERKRQEIARKANQITELHGLYLPPSNQ